MIQTIPVKETRDRLADLLNEVDIAKKKFIITKFGKPKAMLIPYALKSKKSQSLSQILKKTSGMWKNRKDIEDTEAWVRKVRTKLSLRK